MVLKIPDRTNFNIQNKKIICEEKIPLSLKLNGSSESIKKYLNAESSVFRWLKTAKGVALVAKFSEDFLKISSEIGLISARGAAQKYAEGTALIMTFPALPGVWKELRQSVDHLINSYALRNSPEFQSDWDKRINQRKWDKVFHNSAKTMSETSKAAHVFISLGNFPTGFHLLHSLKPFLNAVSFVQNFSSLKMNIENFNSISSICVSSDLTEDCRSILNETKKRSLLSLIKDVVSVASAILGLILIGTGAGIIPGIVFLSLSFTSVIFSIWGEVYEEGMRWKPIDLFDDRHVIPLAVSCS